jgi:hypothetical protein
MKIFFNNCGMIFFSILLVANMAEAKDPTCAGKLERDLTRAALACALIPGVGWYLGLCFAPDFAITKKRINLLRAATSIASGELIDDKAQKLADKYYRHLVKKYPQTELGKEEVINVLHQFNINGYKMGACFQTQFLGNYLFPEGKMSNYIEEQKKFLASEAIRNEKNAHEEIRYFDEGI